MDVLLLGLLIYKIRFRTRTVTVKSIEAQEQLGNHKNDYLAVNCLQFADRLRLNEME